MQWGKWWGEGVKLQNRGRLAAAAVALAAAAVMLTHSAVAERRGEPLAMLPASTVVTGQGHTQREGQININTATAEQLDALPGIGPAKAAAIVAWRTEHGSFRCPEDLIQVSGIGEATLAKLLDQITVGGEGDAENLSGGR